MSLALPGPAWSAESSARGSASWGAGMKDACRREDKGVKDIGVKNKSKELNIRMFTKRGRIEDAWWEKGEEKGIGRIGGGIGK